MSRHFTERSKWQINMEKVLIFIVVSEMTSKAM